MTDGAHNCVECNQCFVCLFFNDTHGGEEEKKTKHQDVCRKRTGGDLQRRGGRGQSQSVVAVSGGGGGGAGVGVGALAEPGSRVSFTARPRKPGVAQKGN